MDIINQRSDRPRRATKKVSRSEDFIDNYDDHLDAIESLPTTTLQRPLLQSIDSGPRKRGRPRKYPIAPPPPPDAELPIKRPRGRPKGSGKHQKAAAAAGGAGYYGNGSGFASESGINSCAVSAAPSSVGPPPQHFSRDFHPPTATPLPPPPIADIKENGTYTPHYPPINHNTSVDCKSPMDPVSEGGGRSVTRGARTTTALYLYQMPIKPPIKPKIEPDTVEPCQLNGQPSPVTAMPDETPTPSRPRNRRKCAAPTKTE